MAEPVIAFWLVYSNRNVSKLGTPEFYTFILVETVISNSTSQAFVQFGYRWFVSFSEPPFSTWLLNHNPTQHAGQTGPGGSRTRGTLLPLPHNKEPASLHLLLLDLRPPTSPLPSPLSPFPILNTFGPSERLPMNWKTIIIVIIQKQIFRLPKRNVLAK